MTESVHIVCPHCRSVNRVTSSRLSDQPSCGACKKQLFTASAIELNSVGFESHVSKSGIPVVVDFWAPWCGPCKMMAPAFEAAAAELEPQFRCGRLNTEDEPEIAARFGIRSIPTMILFRHGKEVARQAGAMRMPEIMRWVRANQ